MRYKHIKEVIEELAEVLTQSVLEPIGILVGLAILIVLTILLHKRRKATHILYAQCCMNSL